MIEPAPRPLSHRRLERLALGLRNRLTTGSHQLQMEHDRLQRRFGELDRERAEALRQIDQRWQSELATLITAWDEATHSGWDEAELRAYIAVSQTAARQRQHRQETRREIDETTQEAQRRAANVERRFQTAIKIPRKRYQELKATGQRLFDELRQVAEAAGMALAQNSIRHPPVENNPPQVRSSHTADEALQNLRTAINDARHHQHRLSHHPQAMFLGSIWWWLICLGSLALVPAILVGFSITSFLPAIIAGGVVTTLLLITGMLGARPILKKVATVEYPKVIEQVKRGEQLLARLEVLATEENDRQLQRLAEKRDTRYQQITDWRRRRIEQLQRHRDEKLRQIGEQAEAEKQHASQQLADNLESTQQDHQQRVAAARSRMTLDKEKTSHQFDDQQRSVDEQLEQLTLRGKSRFGAATAKAVSAAERNRQWCKQHFPDWESLQAVDTAWPPVLERPSFPLGKSVLIAEDLQSSLESLWTPYLFDPITDRYLVITGDASHSLTTGLIRNILLRFLTTLPPGKVQACIVDPPGLGRDFGWLMQLGDFDPTLVTHRVWTQPGHIAKQIQSLAHAAEDFIQQSLRNRYRDITDYNTEAGALSEPYRLLVWTSLPHGLEDATWNHLLSLLDSGARCGIFPILIVDPDAEWQFPAQRDALLSDGLQLTIDTTHNKLHAAGTAGAASQSAEGSAMSIVPDPPADDAVAQAVIHEAGRRALLASRVEVPMEHLLPNGDHRWEGDSSVALDIPIGQSGVGRVQSVQLGHATAQHALIAGKTGSGKSSLLHALITSATLKYSPEHLRLVLLDFKKGVEFQVYSDVQLPHCDIIGIESQREFGLSALEYVDQCMQARGEVFRGSSVQDLASWNALNPDHPMPRMLIIIDEFQELFIEDDALAGRAQQLLDRIVRQGRSFGVHAVLSSQTLAGAYSLPRTTLGQMAVRIALQCDASDAQIIFSEDNPAAARLKHPGQAIYNDSGGRIEGNHSLQVGWLSQARQTELLSDLPSGYQNSDPTSNRLGRTVVFDGNRAAAWESQQAGLAIDSAKSQRNPDAMWCLVGESVSIDPAVCFPFTQQTGRNVLLVGSRDEQAAPTLLSLVASFSREARGECQLFTIQGSKPTDRYALQLTSRFDALSGVHEQVDSRAAETLIDRLHQQLQTRIDEAESTVEPHPVLLVLLGLGRLRSLRNEDDFGLGSFGESQLTAAQKLEELLRDGPSQRMHVVIWADSYSIVSRWLSRAAMREIEIRLLMQMSASDSTNLIDAIDASRLGPHVMLLLDEATGDSCKFRPFAPDSMTEMVTWYRKG